MEAIPGDQQKNYEIFRDCLSTALIEKISQPLSKPKRRSKPKKTYASRAQAPVSAAEPKQDREPEGAADTDLTDADALADFADYIATQTFSALPPELKTLDHYTWAQDASLQARHALPLTGASTPVLVPALDAAVSDSLAAYAVTREPACGVHEFLAPVVSSYIATVSRAPPPPPRATLADADGCELCGRGWVPLSYHHLVPRFVHGKAVRRGWHRAEDLQSVAWLCGACHRFVHRFAGHEDLARRFYTVELLLAEEPVRRWVDWVARLRWKGR
ncbi:hypothetical protein GGR54DRAFT_420219 [Hypoxylon sp. NC1633]|nr:hypothetical protein GGR54DRAFT_420219 [Hypoxylon sp. NC1633]